MCNISHVPRRKHQGKVHKSLQNCGFPVGTLLQVTLLGPRIWKWIPDFWKIWGPPKFPAAETSTMLTHKLAIGYHPALICFWTFNL